MKKKKSLILRLLPWLIVLAAIAALVIFVFVPIYSQKESKFGPDPEVYEYEAEKAPLTMERPEKYGIPTRLTGKRIPLPAESTRKPCPPRSM